LDRERAQERRVVLQGGDRSTFDTRHPTLDMRAYRWSVRLKLGLIVFAVGIALASLWYTHRLVDRLRDREQVMIQLWADAQEQVAKIQYQSFNPHREELRQLDAYLRRVQQQRLLPGPPLPDTTLRAFREAVRWAQTMPPTGELNFVLNEILEPNPFRIPAIITDSLTQEPFFWRNVDVPDRDSLRQLPPQDSARAMRRLRELRREMDQTFEPIPIRLDFADAPGLRQQRLTQYVHYDESWLIKELQIFPWVQLLFVGLFILVGYFGFSYVRRSEQSSLWVGMAREAAHQLGTPISSLMGWTELLRSSDLDEMQRNAIDEIENDVDRLQRVANRFSDIGSMPKLDRQPLAPIVEQTAAYIRRRMPQRGGQQVTLAIDVPNDLEAPVNEELFAWVIENLLKNALDAMDEDEGRIEVTAASAGGHVHVDVSDTGCGIERREWKNVFRPGFSTKKRGWGLGLSLAKRVIEDYHNGALRVHASTVGEGTTFRIELPT
jgi:hypothetical protein